MRSETMAADYIEELREVVDATAADLLRLSPEAAARRPASGGWSIKEVVGHLIDSASNNHQRFVRAHWQEDLVFTGYAHDTHGCGQSLSARLRDG